MIIHEVEQDHVVVVETEDDDEEDPTAEMVEIERDRVVIHPLRVVIDHVLHHEVNRNLNRHHQRQRNIVYLNHVRNLVRDHHPRLSLLNQTDLDHQANPDRNHLHHQNIMDMVPIMDMISTMDIISDEVRADLNQQHAVHLNHDLVHEVDPDHIL